MRGETYVDDVVQNKGGAVTQARLTWIKAGNRKMKSWDNTTLGSIRLEKGRLVADVNSERRAGRLTREIAKRLGPAAVLRDTRVEDPADLLEQRARRRLAGELVDEPEGETEERPPELQSLEQEILRQQWDAWLDTRVPALGNRTPRQLSKSERGRERLEALLSDFDRARRTWTSRNGQSARSIADRTGTEETVTKSHASE